MSDPFFPNTPMPATPVQPANTPAPQQAPTRPASAPQKPIRKISTKTFMVGCATLFMIVVWGLTIIFYNLIKNPTQLTNLGIDPNSTKTLLQAFAAIFFGLLTFLGIGILVSGLYRLVTVKNKPKIWYAFRALWWFFLFVFGIALGAQVLTMVRNISIENILDSNKLIMPYIQLKTGPQYTRTDATLKLVAPASMYYSLNTNYFNSQIVPQLGQASITSMVLDCGNGQTLNLNFTTRQFEWSCIYFQKWDYTLKLTVNYINVPTGEKLQKDIDAGTLTMDAQVGLQPNNGDVTYNDAKTEMSVGKVPSKVTFDASQLFKDLNLADYKILWDFDGDGTRDKQNQASATFVYKEAKLYNVNIRLPLLNNYIYTFPVRVEQSDVPVCEISAKQNKEAAYTFTTDFLEKNIAISAYQFDIIDTANKNNVIDTVKSNDPTFSYEFPGKWTYAIQTTFLTEDGKQGQCESDDIQVGATYFQIYYDINYKSPGSPQFQKVLASGAVAFTSGTVIINEIPTVVQIQINQVVPTSASTTKSVLLDGKKILSTDSKTFEMTIDDSQDHTITIVVEDANRGTKTEETIKVTTKRNDIIGKLIITPDTVGLDPFTVKFDASTTKINDQTDEIVYFTRDFGDGIVKKNLSEAVVTHTYTYDIKTDNGIYKPVLTITTKKGRQISISPANNIIVKRANQSLNIRIDSHPAQVANIWDRVSFSLAINGLPSELHRNFGNGKTLDCQGRDCIQAAQIYDTAGTYTIKAEAVFDNQPTIEGTIVLKVK